MLRYSRPARIGQAAILFALLALVSTPATAQQLEHAAKPARSSSDTSAMVLNEVFPGSYVTVMLAGDVSYRLELRAAAPTLPAATVTIRSLRNQGAPPLVLTPIGDQAAPSGGHSYLLIPDHSDEYRVDVATDEMLFVRIIRDDPETRRWASARAESQRLGQPGLGVSAVSMGALGRDDADARVGGRGVGLCLGTFHNGGCVMDLALFSRGGAGTGFSLGMEPRHPLAGNRRVLLSVGANFGIGESTNHSAEQTYVMAGGGVIGDWAALPHLTMEMQVGLLATMALHDSMNGSAFSPTLPGRIAIGLRYR
ncbi:MAG TPA: hypothetical protein VGI92_14245 [Gemmatimonadales bacterium]|jgi:hypothetical protein